MKKWILVLLSSAVVCSAVNNDSKDEKDVLAAMDAWKQATMKEADGPALEKAAPSRSHLQPLIRHDANQGGRH